MTIATELLVYFPLLLGFWRVAPLTTEQAMPPEAPTFLTRVEVLHQEQFFRQLREPEIRSRVALELAGSNNPEAVAALARLAAEETDPGTLADLLTAMDALRHLKCRPAISPTWVRHESAPVRARAMALLIAEGVTAPVLEQLAGERDPFVLRLAWERLAATPEACPPAPLTAGLNHPEALGRAGAATVICRQAADPDDHPGLAAGVTDRAVAVRVVLAAELGRRPNGGRELLRKLAGDPHPSVRCGVADAVAAPGRMELHLRLSADRDGEVRRLACMRLRDYPLATVADALLARLDDPDEAARIAAEDSLIALQPGKELHDRIIADLARPGTCAAAVKILGALKVAAAIPALRPILTANGHFELLRRTVVAIGQLGDRESWAAVCALRTHPRYEVRQAVAWTLGRLAVPESYPQLIELSRDQSVPVFNEALTSMGLLGDPVFCDELNTNLREIMPPKGHVQRRAAAAWAWARNSRLPDETALRLAENICLKKIIPAMGIMHYDSEYSRASSCFLLVEAARRDPQLRPVAERIVGRLADPNQDRADPMSGLCLQAFARQAMAYLNDREPVLEPVPLGHVPLSVRPIEPSRP